MPSSLPASSRSWRHAVALGVAAVALRAVLQPWLGDAWPLPLAFVATVVSAWLWGTGPGLLTAIICAGAVALPMIPPQLPADARPVQIGGFLGSAVLVALLCGQLGRARSLQQPPTVDGAHDTALTVWLRAVLWSAMLIPALAFVVVAWWGFERAQRDAATSALRAAELTARHAETVFGIAAEIARRVDAMVPGDDAAVRADEAGLHRRLADMKAGLPSVVNLNVWAADGSALVGSDNFPARPGVSVADRAYFREQRDAPLPLGLSDVLTGRQSGRELVNATLRRSSPDGSFRGIVAVSLSPEFFRQYYRSLASEQPNVASFTLIRSDGTILARWPPASEVGPRVPADAPTLVRIRDGAASGVIVTGTTPTRESRLVGFRRLSNYPAYVAAGFSRSAMLADWVHFVALLAAVLLPVTAGLVYVTWVAIQRTRREQATAVELREAIRRRSVAERSMLEAQRLETLSMLTGGVAHDFNNLLAIVNTNLHLHKTLNPALASSPQLQSMQRAIQSGARLTRQLLSFSRKQSMRPETVVLQDWLAGAEALLKSTLGSNIRWQVEVDPETTPITVDVAEFELALINLALNARHAMPDGGTFRVVARNADADAAPGRAMVMVCAQDDGTGIAADVLPRVLEPFFTTRTRGAGSGLGLSQVNGLAVEAGGFVRIDSQPGAGTTVRIFLPAAATAAAAPVPPEPAEVPSPQAALAGRVLVVEDNDEVAAATVEMLRGAGFTVVRAADAAAALAHLRGDEAQPDAVLTDIAMPGPMNGIDLAFKLRAERPALPVLLTTGYADQISHATRAGFKVLRKPAEPLQMLAELRAMLG